MTADLAGAREGACGNKILERGPPDSEIFGGFADFHKTGASVNGTRHLRPPPPALRRLVGGPSAPDYTTLPRLIRAHPQGGVQMPWLTSFTGSDVRTARSLRDHSGIRGALSGRQHCWLVPRLPYAPQPLAAQHQWAATLTAIA